MFGCAHTRGYDRVLAHDYSWAQRRARHLVSSNPLNDQRTKDPGPLPYPVAPRRPSHFEQQGRELLLTSRLEPSLPRP